MVGENVLYAEGGTQHSGGNSINPGRGKGAAGIKNRGGDGHIVFGAGGGGGYYGGAGSGYKDYYTAAAAGGSGFIGGCILDSSFPAITTGSNGPSPAGLDSPHYKPGIGYGGSPGSSTEDGEDGGTTARMPSF